MQLDAVSRRRLANFRANRRALWSLRLFSFLFLLSLVAEGVANDRPLLVWYQGQVLSPAVTAYPETRFGGEFETEADYRDPFVTDLIRNQGAATVAEGQSPGRILWAPIRFDHATIYLMIAGTYTPMAYVLLDTAWFVGMMVAIWGMALGGVVWKLFFYQEDNIWSLAYYLGMGWFSIILLPHVLQFVNIVAFVLIVCGGLMYTIGAIIFGLKKPNINQWWGHHEIWHLFTLAGFAFHFFAIIYKFY